MDRLIPIYTSMPGFISYRYYTGEDGEEIAISRFASREAMQAWVRQPDHVEVQRMAGRAVFGLVGPDRREVP